jgi:PEP-CTERM motif
MGNIMIRRKILAALPLVGALTLSAHAEASTINWHLGDGGVSAGGTLTILADPNSGSDFGDPTKNLVPSGPGYVGVADPLSASIITNVTGVFSDSALGIKNEAITGILANNYAPHFAPDPTIPYSFSYYTPMNPMVSYDNLFYVNGSPQTCSIPSPPSLMPPGNYGGYFDNYGVMLTLANGDYVDLYSNGDIQATQLGALPVTLPPYGVVVIQNGVPDYTNAQSLAFNTPEPSTWAMMVLGFAGLGFAGYRRAGKAAVVAA